MEVAIPSICKPRDITYVVIPRETERFVNEIHNHNAEVRSSKELLDNLQESKEGTPRHKETWAAPSTKEARAGSLTLVPKKASFMLIQDVEVIWQCRFPKQSRPCYVISIKTNESLMVRDIGSQSNQCWCESLHMKEHEISVTKRGCKRSSKAAQRKELSTVKIKMEFYVTYELFKGILVGIQSNENGWTSPILGNGTDSRRKRERESPSGCPF